MRTAALSSIALAVVLVHSASPASAKVTRYLTGSAADVSPALSGPALNLGGGGTDVDAALQAMIDAARGCTSCATTVDVVILRASGSDGYNDYIFAMNGVDSVETLVITKRSDADTAAVETTVKNAEVVFYAGGDQCNYTTLFKGTKVETATELVYAKGGAIGGTSAGMAIQSEFVYNGCTASATSADILANPYHRSATFSYDFFAWTDMGDTLTEQHLVTRDRMGRLMGFLARQIQDGRTPTALGVAADEVTSIVVDDNGTATVLGEGTAYFVLADHFPEQCAAKKPLTYSNYKIWRVLPGGTFDLRNRPTTGYYTVSVTNGVLSGSPY
jgi:cyanophycinase